MIASVRAPYVDRSSGNACDRPSRNVLMTDHSSHSSTESLEDIHLLGVTQSHSRTKSPKKVTQGHPPSRTNMSHVMTGEFDESTRHGMSSRHRRRRTTNRESEAQDNSRSGREIEEPLPTLSSAR